MPNRRLPPSALWRRKRSFAWSAPARMAGLCPRVPGLSSASLVVSAFVRRSGLALIFGGLADLHLGPGVDSIRSRRDHLLRALQSAQHLHVIAVADAQRDLLLHRCAVGTDNHHALAAIVARQHRRLWNLHRVLN